MTHFIFCRGSDTLSEEWEACSGKETVLIADQEKEQSCAVAALQGSEVIGPFVYEGILVHGNWSRLEEMSGSKRNSQDDTPPRSKINTETDSREMREDKTCNVHSLGWEDSVLPQWTDEGFLI